MTTYTHTAEQHEFLKAMRQQLLDSPHKNDHAAAARLDWVLTAEPVEPVKGRKAYRFHMNLDGTELGVKLFDRLEASEPGCGVIAQVYPDGFVATILSPTESRAISEMLGGDYNNRQTYLGDR